jgi:hypothetical protein
LAVRQFEVLKNFFNRLFDLCGLEWPSQQQSN